MRAVGQDREPWGPVRTGRVWSRTDTGWQQFAFVGVWWERREKRSAVLVGSQQLWEDCECHEGVSGSCLCS